MFKNLKIYAKSIAIPVVLGGLVGFIISGFIDYKYLQKPFFAPPGIVFPIVWTLLYILMGISYGILDSKSLTDSKINSIYYLQLFVNLLWPIIFFIAKLRLFAFIWILLLTFLVFVMIIRFYDKNKFSSFLQFPYLIWSLFATYLNLFIYLLN